MLYVAFFCITCPRLVPGQGDIVLLYHLPNLWVRRHTYATSMYHLPLLGKGGSLPNCSILLLYIRYLLLVHGDRYSVIIASVAKSDAS